MVEFRCDEYESKSLGKLLNPTARYPQGAANIEFERLVTEISREMVLAIETMRLIRSLIILLSWAIRLGLNILILLIKDIPHGIMFKISYMVFIEAIISVYEYMFIGIMCLSDVLAYILISTLIWIAGWVIILP